MTAKARFIGYVEYQPNHHHAEFVVTGHHTIPDDSQVSYETLQAFKIPIPPFDDMYTWRRAEFAKRRALWKKLKEWNLS